MTDRKDDHSSADPILEKGRPRAVDVRHLRDLPPGIVPVADVQSWAERLAPAFYLDVGNVCNQHCLYCAVPREKAYRAKCRDVELVAAAAVGHSYDCAALIGGEPTVWPNLIPTLQSIREGGVARVILATNGLTLASPGYLDELVGAGVDCVGLSLDDFDPAVQRRLTRHHGNPELVAAALGNLAAREGVHTYVYTVVTGALSKRMADHVAACLRWADSFHTPPVFIFAGLKPVATALANWPELAISLAQTGELVAQAIGGMAGRVTVAYRDIPLCQPGLEPGHSLDLPHEQAAIDLGSGAARVAPLARDRTFVAACDGCRLRNWCPGIYQDYVAVHGDKEFQPVV